MVEHKSFINSQSRLPSGTGDDIAVTTTSRSGDEVVGGSEHKEEDALPVYESHKNSLNSLLFGMTETEWNRWCDSQKCKYGNYCNTVQGLCSRCIWEKGTPEQKQELLDRKAKDKHGLCLKCHRPIGIYEEGYTHQLVTSKGSICNLCFHRVSNSFIANDGELL